MSWNEEIKKELLYCGENVRIGHNTIFTNPKNVYLGSNVRIDPFCIITTELVTGNNVQIMSHAVLSGGPKSKIELFDWTFIGYHSRLFCASEDYSGDFGPVNADFNEGNKIHRENIVFEKYAGVASNVTVMPGTHLPEGCEIGADSFVYNNSYYEISENFETEEVLPTSIQLDGKPSTISRKYKTTSTIFKASKKLQPYVVYVGNPLRYHKRRNIEKLQEWN